MTRARDIIKAIPHGKVVTYGLIAAHAGNHRGARQVARLLHSSSQKENLPWHRVVNRNGMISLKPFQGYETQKQLLENEGIIFSNKDAINFDSFLWHPTPDTQDTQNIPKRINMKTTSVSAAFTTNKVEETRDFYVKYLEATVTFDCGWYVNLQFGNGACTLQFMSPQQPEHSLCNPAGLTYNFQVNDVDREYNRLLKEGLEPKLPIEDHPWGDRGFAIQDPNGIMLYLYSEREPNKEFKKYYKT